MSREFSPELQIVQAHLPVGHEKVGSNSELTAALHKNVFGFSIGYNSEIDWESDQHKELTFMHGIYDYFVKYLSDLPIPGELSGLPVGNLIISEENDQRLLKIHQNQAAGWPKFEVAGKELYLGLNSIWNEGIVPLKANLGEELTEIPSVVMIHNRQGLLLPEADAA